MLNFAFGSIGIIIAISILFLFFIRYISNEKLHLFTVIISFVFFLLMISNLISVVYSIFYEIFEPSNMLVSTIFYIILQVTAYLVGTLMVFRLITKEELEKGLALYIGYGIGLFEVYLNSISAAITNLTIYAYAESNELLSVLTEQYGANSANALYQQYMQSPKLYMTYITITALASLIVILSFTMALHKAQTSKNKKHMVIAVAILLIFKLLFQVLPLAGYGWAVVGMIAVVVAATFCMIYYVM